MSNSSFWLLFDKLIENASIVIGRPRGSAHPRFPHIHYPLDYGYLSDTSSMDGEGIDVWLGSELNPTLCGIICTVDLLKKDSEVKLLLGCTPEETHLALAFHNDSEYMKGILLLREDSV